MLGGIFSKRFFRRVVGRKVWGVVGLGIIVELVLGVWFRVFVIDGGLRGVRCYLAFLERRLGGVC